MPRSRAARRCATIPRDIPLAQQKESGFGKHFSNKHFNKKRRRNVRSYETAEIIEFQTPKFEVERTLPPIKPLNPTQAAYLDALRTGPQVVVLGPPAPARPGSPRPMPPTSTATV